MPEARVSRLPLLMSTLVYPGVGQFMQRRVFWGLVYSIAFTFFFVLLVVIMVRQFFQLWNNPEDFHAGLRALAKPFGLTVLVWLANIYDTWWASRLAQRRPPAGAEPPASGPG
jgi:hypothetical protein